MRSERILSEFPESSDLFPVPLPHFPTVQQAVIWRNWEMVPVERLASLLGTTNEKVLEMGEQLGLPVPPVINPHWLTRGYITIIKANWHLLPFRQLLELLEWNESRMGFALKEDDFLWIKLGRVKPALTPVKYEPLTTEQLKETAQLRDRLQKHFPDYQGGQTEEAFSFLEPAAAYNPGAAHLEAPGPGRTVLDNTWEIAACGLTERGVRFAERFTRKHEARWGHTIPFVTYPAVEAAPAYGNKQLQLVVIQVEEQNIPAESHWIDIGPAHISIKAVDEVGLLRGLHFLQRMMERGRAPYLQLGTYNRTTRFDLRYVYSYFGIYGDPLLETEMDPYPDELLERLSEQGVNGVWLQAVLYQLVPFEPQPELSEGWERRLEGLRRLASRAAEYGIGIYLYYNEPRAMPHAFFDRYPEWKGHTAQEYASLCTSHPDVQSYLRNSTARLFKEVPELAGLFTITMSANQTNCYSTAYMGKTNCPRCASRRPDEVVAEVNRLITEGAQSAKPSARIIGWTWGWTGTFNWDEATVERAIHALPDTMELMCVSEDEIPTHIGGVPGILRDYSVSIVGPGTKSIRSWETARQRGMGTIAKVQFNTSWECSAVPYLPVVNLVAEHLEGLVQSGVNGLMLGWTLGGYPSYLLEMAAEVYWGDTEYEGLSQRLVEGKAEEMAGPETVPLIMNAWKTFSEAFKHFPFDVTVLYLGPHNVGPGNLLYAEPTGYSATMVCFPYDDLTRWRGIYPVDVYEEQLRLLAEGWQSGMEAMDQAVAEASKQGAVSHALLDIRDVAKAANCHFRSSYLQTRFVQLRSEWEQAGKGPVRLELSQQLEAFLQEEINLAKILYELVCRDSRIGYEASNHYYYTPRSLQEKVLNVEKMLEMFVGSCSRG
jgi:hypothetical protein